MTVRMVTIHMKRSQNNSHSCNFNRWEEAVELAASNGWDPGKDLLNWHKRTELTREEATAMGEAISKGLDNHPDGKYLEGLISWLTGISNREGYILQIDPSYERD